MKQILLWVIGDRKGIWHDPNRKNWKILQLFIAEDLLKQFGRKRVQKMRPMILIFLLLLISRFLCAQDITKAEGDSLIKALKSARGDPERMELLLKVAEYHIISNYDHPSNFDTAMLLIRQAENLNERAKSKAVDFHLLLVTSYFLRMSGKRENGKDIILKLINLLKNGSYYHMLGRAYYELSNYYDYDFKPNTISQRAAYVQMAITAFEKSGDINDLGNSYKVLADLHHLDNEYAKARSELEKSLEYYKSSHYKRMEGVYDLFGQLNYAKGDFKQALAYELLALKTTNTNNDYGPQLCEIENNVGLTFYKLNDGEAALRHFKNAVAIAEKERDIETVFGLTSHIVDAYILLNQPNEALGFLQSVEKKYKIPESDKLETKGYMYKAYLNLYTTLKQYNNGRYYCAQLITKSKVPGLDVFKLNGYYEQIIKYYTAIRDYPEALKYLKLNEELLDSMHYDMGLSLNYSLWFSLDTAQGNYRSGVNNLVKANLIKDTILNAAKNREIDQLDVQYESEKKENDIKLLQKEKQLQGAMLLQAKNTRNWILGAVAMLVIIVTLLVYNSRLKQRTNKKLKTQGAEIEKQNDKLRHLVTEKDWLVKEIHHRVKNNLQMVVSLLNAQTEFLTHPSAIDAIKESRERMQAIAIIHQKLYQIDNTTEVNMRSYINDLVDNIKSSFADSERIYFKLNVDNVGLDISQSVPLGLILNEAITNALKYAYAKNEKGLIQISLKHYDDDRLQLKIADNGKGLPTNVNIDQSNSLGLQLIKLFSEQLDGELYFVNTNGLEITLNFKTTDYKNTINSKVVA